jgi:hypothetical protein
VLHAVSPTSPRSREEWIFWIAYWGRATRNPKLAAAQKRRHAAFRRVLEGCLAQARERGELAARLDLTHEAAGIAALAWGLGVLGTFEPRALTKADIEREIEARIRRLRA